MPTLPEKGSTEIYMVENIQFVTITTRCRRKLRLSFGTVKYKLLFCTWINELHLFQQKTGRTYITCSGLTNSRCVDLTTQKSTLREINCAIHVQ